MKTWSEIEAGLARAVDEGIEPNFARWMRFAGIAPGEWLELQVLGLRTTYGDRTRFAHADSLEAAVRLLAAAERFNASGSYVIANRVNDAVAPRRDPGKWHDALKGESTTDRDITARRVILIDVDAKRPSSATRRSQGSSRSRSQRSASCSHTTSSGSTCGRRRTMWWR